MNTQKGHSLVLILVTVLVIAVLASGAAYYYFVYSKSQSAPASYVAPVTTEPTSNNQVLPQTQPIQSGSEVDKLTTEVNNMQTDTGDSVSVSDTVGL